MATITTTQLDESAVRVIIPGVGELTVMAYAEEDGTQGFRIMEDLAPTAAATEVGPI